MSNTRFCNSKLAPGAGGGRTAALGSNSRSESSDELRALSIAFEQSADRTMDRGVSTGSSSVGVTGIDHIGISATDLCRSIGFYMRVFGFRIIEDGRNEPHPFVIMTASGRAYLAIHEAPTAEPGGPSPAGGHWGFVVGDLDRVRQAIWDLGVPVSGDSGTPDQIHEWSNSRSLYVNDPDGNIIELVEVWGGGLSVP